MIGPSKLKPYTSIGSNALTGFLTLSALQGCNLRCSVATLCTCAEENLFSVKESWEAEQSVCQSNIYTCGRFSVWLV